MGAKQKLFVVTVGAILFLSERLNIILGIVSFVDGG